jgi:Glycosyl hydrolase family 99
MQRKIVYRFVSLFIAISLLVGANLVAHTNVQAAPANATAVTFNPVADAYVLQTSASPNYGSDAFLRVDNSRVTRRSLRFVVTGGAVQSAMLSIDAKSANPTGFTVKALANNTWAENSITYSNAPMVTLTKKSAATYTSNPSTIFLPIITKAPLSPNTPRIPGGSSYQPSFPIRAAFYYPWFSEAWTQHGIHPYTNYNPKLGFYSNTDQNILKQHIAMMQYGNIQAGIASWWGQGSQTDTKIAGLLTAAAGTNFRWALYYENESQADPSVNQIQNDLTYIQNHYATDASFLRVNGKFVIFVYAAGNDGCGMADRWKQANTVGAYVVLKVFPGYDKCASQPDAWHQYSPAVATDQQGSMSFAISPGFWLKSNPVRLMRDLTRWTQNVQAMVASGANWQLITTFSEWGEGTSVEPALEWASPSGYGQYLDVLHTNGK